MAIQLLVVDNDDAYLTYLDILLKSTGKIEIIKTCKSWEIAENIIYSSKPDVVTLELKLLDMDGVDLIKNIKNHSPETAVLILSELRDSGNIAKAIKVGVNGFLIKNESHDLIVNAIIEVCNGPNSQIPMSPTALTEVVKKCRNLLNKNISQSLNKSKDKNKLTSRQKEVLEYYMDGLDARSIAKKIGKKLSTVYAHTRDLYKKLNAHGIPDAINKALAKGEIKKRISNQ